MKVRTNIKAGQTLDDLTFLAHNELKRAIDLSPMNQMVGGILGNTIGKIENAAQSARQMSG